LQFDGADNSLKNSKPHTSKSNHQPGKALSNGGAIIDELVLSFLFLLSLLFFHIFNHLLQYIFLNVIQNKTVNVHYMFYISSLLGCVIFFVILSPIFVVP